jgi:hypothetical protein
VVYPTQSSTASRASWAAKLFVLVLIVGLVMVAVAGFALSFAQPAGIQTWLDRQSNHGNAGLSIELIHSIEMRLRAACVVSMIAVGVLILAFRRIVPSLALVLAALNRDAIILRADIALEMSALRRAWWVSIACFVVVGVAIRWVFIRQPMRVDECSTYLFFMSKSLLIAVSNYPAPNNHVFHSAIGNMIVHLFGNSEIAIRSPAFISGILLIPATAILGALLYKPAVGLLAGAMVASSSYLVEYSTNARGYTLQALLLLIALPLAIHARSRSNYASAFTAGIVAAFGFWTLPTMLYPFAGICVWWLASDLCGRPRSLLMLSACRLIVFAGTVVIVSLVLYSPIILTRGLHALTGNEYVVALPLRSFLAGLPEMARGVRMQFFRDIPTIGAIPIGAAMVIGAFSQIRGGGDVPILFSIAFTAIIVVVAQRVTPFVRVWIFAWPLCYLAAAMGLNLALRYVRMSDQNALKTLFAVSLIYLGLTGALVVRNRSVMYSHETGQVLQAPALASFLHSVLRPSDQVIGANEQFDLPIQYYLKIRGHPIDVMRVEGGPVTGRAYIVTLPNRRLEDAMKGVTNADSLQAPKLVYAVDNANVYLLEK